MIPMVLLIVLVALAGGSPVFAQLDGAVISFTPAAACRGERVTFTLPADTGDVVGGGISVAVVSPLANREVVVVTAPAGLLGPDSNLECTRQGTPAECTFVVSESASCGHYTVTVRETIGEDSLTRILGSGTFDVAGPCCAVGGCVQPVNTFALVSPYLAVIAVVGCIGTAVVVAKKRGK